MTAERASAETTGGTAPTPGTTRLRADARRNRDQIIAAATAIFAEQGTEVPMEEIARAAGVGVGTLYRRFPDRESLIRAVAVENFRMVLDNARAAAEEEPDAWQALTRFLHLGTGLRLTVQLAVHSARAQGVLAEDEDALRIRQELIGLLDRLVAAAQAEGTLRSDIGAGDIALILSLLLRPLPPISHELAAAAPDRYLSLVLDGLRTPLPSPLPGRRVNSTDLRWRGDRGDE